MEDVWIEHLRSRVQLWLQSDRHFPKLNVMPFPPIDKDKFQKDDYCAILQFIKVLDDMIKERQKYGWINCEKCKTLIQDVSMFEEVLKYINNGIITISVSGRFNAGKSSLINCLLQNIFLPEDARAETAVRVYIQHDPSIHVTCSGPASCSKCPRMKPFANNPTPLEEIYGVQKIQAELKKMNSKVRAKEQKMVDQLLVTNVPALAICDAKASGSLLHLVDNPGTGESNESATALADLSLKTSEAVLYIIDYNAIDEKEVVEFRTKNSQISRDGQFIVVVNKMDSFYSDSSSTSVTVEEEMKRVKSLLSKKLAMPEECVVPVSSRWKKWYQSYSPEQKDDIDFYTKQYSKKSKTSHLCASSSQSTMNNQDVVTLEILREGSNFDELQKKLEEVVQTCVHQDASYLKKKTLGLLTYANEQYRKFAEKETKWLNEMKKKVDSLKEQLTILATKSHFKSLTDTTELKVELEREYEKDIQKPVDKLKLVLRKWLDNYAQKKPHLTFKTFREDILDTFVTDLHNTLARTASFDAMNAVLQSYICELGRTSSQLESSASTLRSQLNAINPSASSEAHDETAYSVRKDLVTREDMIPTPNLVQIERDQNIFSFGLTLWNKISIMIRNWLHVDDPIGGVRLRSSQLREVIEKIKGYVPEECDTYFVANKNKIIEWMLLQYQQIARNELAIYCSKWDDYLKIAEKSISELDKMTNDWEKYVEHILENGSYMDKLQTHLMKAE